MEKKFSEKKEDKNKKEKEELFRIQVQLHLMGEIMILK